MGLADYVREKMKSFLQIQPPRSFAINLDGMLDWNGNAIKNKVWYRGDATEIEELYRQIDLYQNRHLFWASIPTAGLEIAKRHTGMPAIIVDTLASICTNNLTDITLEDAEQNRIWEDTFKENKFEKLLNKAVSTALYVGDGAFKVSFDPEISSLPIIEFVDGEHVDYVYNRGRITEIIFSSVIKHDSTPYTLKEIYGNGYIRFKLFKGDTEVGMQAIPEVARYQDYAFGNALENKYMLAVPLMFYQSEKYYGRGRSVFDKKIDAFDGLDEAWSQWLDALRAGRTKTYIPINLIPRDPNTGQVRKPNAFDNRFIQTEEDLRENAQNRVVTESAPIQHDGYLSTYITALDLALQGLISPSTIGIDVKKLDNAEAQREKEKVTLYTRSVIIEALQEDLELLVENTIKAYFEWARQQIVDNVKVEVTFGDYANPSFESQVETVVMAKQGGVMSIDTVVEELYGDTRDDEWKKEEVARLKAESGIEEVEEPRVNFDMYTAM